MIAEEYFVIRERIFDDRLKRVQTYTQTVTTARQGAAIHRLSAPAREHIVEFLPVISSFSTGMLICWHSNHLAQYFPLLYHVSEPYCTSEEVAVRESEGYHSDQRGKTERSSA